MAEVWEAEDRLGRAVVLTAERRAHILNRHEDMANHLDAIRQAIESPEVVTRDRQYAHREIAYRREDGLYLKVAVHYRPVPPQGTWVGVVRTAHLREEIDPKEELLWT